MATLQGTTGLNRFTDIHRPIELSITPVRANGSLKCYRYAVSVIVSGLAAFSRDYEFSEDDLYYGDCKELARGFIDVHAVIGAVLPLRVWNEGAKYPATAEISNGWISATLTSFSSKPDRNINVSIYCEMEQPDTYQSFMLRAAATAVEAFGRQLISEEVACNRNKGDDADHEDG